MSTLRIRLFGTVRVSHDSLAQDVRPIHAVQSLLAWLLLNRQKIHAREVLASLFWADQSDVRARGCLSTALWRLCQLLEPEGIPRGTYLIRQSDAVGFNCASDYWLDVAAFEDGVGGGIEEAMNWYSGDLLEGFYEDWVIRERERLRMLFLNGLGKLLRSHSDAGDLERAAHFGQKILALDPLREDVHRELMRLHLRGGQRSLALQQYESCRALLREELGIRPMEETRSLFAGLLSITHDEPRAATEESAERTGGRPAPSPAPQLAPKLRMAVAKLDEARDVIADVLRTAHSQRK